MTVALDSASLLGPSWETWAVMHMHMVAYHGQAIALRGAESAMHVHMLGLYPEGGGESQSHTHAHGRSSP